MPLQCKFLLTLEEASVYTGIGVNKLREITDEEEGSDLVLFVGTKRMIKRVKIENWLLEQTYI